MSSCKRKKQQLPCSSCENPCIKYCHDRLKYQNAAYIGLRKNADCYDYKITRIQYCKIGRFIIE